MRYLFVLMLLTGCVSAEQRAANIIAHFGPFCERLGFERYTDGWRNCILQQQQQGEAQVYQGIRALQSIQPPRPATQQTFCRPDGIGGVTCITQ